MDIRGGPESERYVQELVGTIIIAMIIPRIHAWMVLQGISGSSVLATADRTSAYGESWLGLPILARSKLGSKKRAPVTSSMARSIAQGCAEVNMVSRRERKEVKRTVERRMGSLNVMLPSIEREMGFFGLCGHDRRQKGPNNLEVARGSVSGILRDGVGT